MSVLDDTYDESEAFGPLVVSDELVASIKAELNRPVDKPEAKPYTKPVNAPQEQKETKVAQAKPKLDNSKLREIDPRLIKVEEGFNARDFSTKENKEHVAELKSSVKEVGVLEPLTIRYEQKTSSYFLVGGESRLRAVNELIADGTDIKSVPIVFEQKGLSAEDRVAQQMLRNDGKQFNILEQGTVFARLKAYGWNDTDIAKKTNKTGPFIGSVLKLNAAPAKLKKLISDGQVSATLVLDIARNAEFDWEKAYNAISDAIATATALGGDKATRRHVDPKKAPKKEAAGTPLHFQRGNVTVFIDVLAEIAADTSLHRGTRTKAKNALENADIDWKDWIKSTAVEEEEE